MMITILGYLFLVIFALTAVLTLASLPGWIEIPDEYRKILFRVLLLEVIGAIILLYTNSFINPPDPEIKFEVSPSNWVAFNTDSAAVIQATAIITRGGDTLRKPVGQPLASGNLLFNANNTRGLITEEGLVVQNRANGRLGLVPSSILSQLGLFNTIKSIDRTSSSSDNYRLVKFEPRTDGSWVPTSKFITDCPFYAEVFSGSKGTGYRIIRAREEEKPLVLFSSYDVNGDPINFNQRLIHFYEDPDSRSFYLFRITGADLLENEIPDYVNIMQLKLEPGIE